MASSSGKFLTQAKYLHVENDGKQASGAGDQILFRTTY